MPAWRRGSGASVSRRTRMWHKMGRILVCLAAIAWAGCAHTTGEPSPDPIPRDPNLSNLEYRCHTEIRCTSSRDSVLVVGRIINRGGVDIAVYGRFALSGGYRPFPTTIEAHQGQRLPVYRFIGFPHPGCCEEYRIPAGDSVEDTLMYEVIRAGFEGYPGTIDAIVSFWRWRGKTPRSGDQTGDVSECLADSIADLSIRVP